jgi:hypothetical protein
VRIVFHRAFWAIGAILSTSSGCADRVAVAERPMGRLPQAVTTAEPEWMPLAVRAGRPVDDDPRERHWAETRRLTEGVELLQIAWSPGSSKLAYAAERPGSKDATATLVDLATGRSSSLSRPEERVSGLRFTGEDRVVFVTSTAARRFLVSTRLDGTDRSTIELAEEPVALGPSAGPEALWLTVRTRDGHALARSSRLGGDLRLVVGAGVAGSAPDASQRVGRVAFVGADGALRLASEEGRGERALARDAFGRAVHPAFDGTGEHLYFASDRDVAGGELYRVESDPASWPPRAERLSFAQASLGTPSPDGRLVAFASRRGGPTNDLYVARLGAPR